MLDITQIVRDGQAFTVTSGLITVSGMNEYDFLYLKNPVGSGKDILITHFKFGSDSSTSRTLFKVYKNPTVSDDGNPADIANTLVASSTPDSGMESYTDPTVTDRGEILNLDISPSNSPSKGLNRFYWVLPGNSVLITVDNSVANSKTFADIYWAEGI